MTERLPTRLPDVTERQREVARLVAAGYTNERIARELGISADGAKYHVSELLGRLGLTRREEITAWYREEAPVPHRRVRTFAAPLAWSAGGVAVAAATIAILLAFNGALSRGAPTGGPEATPTPTASPSPSAAETPTAFAPSLVPGTFTVAHPDLLPRAWSTTTVLDDDRVLIAGGRHYDPATGGDENIPEAEVFDPGAGRVVLSGPLETPRWYHRAALLDDGRVMLIGGVRGGITPLATTEVYDPATNTFQAGPEMTVPRAAHAAVQLADGRILVSGGHTEEAGSTAEVYDPASGVFTATGSMNVPRFGHRLMLLHDGGVLVSGGGALEIYRPETGTFELLELTPPGSHPTATLLDDGRVLLAGGSDLELLFPGPPNSHGGGPATNRLVIFDPDSRTLLDGGEMLHGRQDHAAVRLADGRILITGGAQDAHYDEPFLAEADIYDPESGTSTATGLMREARVGHLLTLLPDGTVLATGIASSSARIGVERYTP